MNFFNILLPLLIHPENLVQIGLLVFEILKGRNSFGEGGVACTEALLRAGDLGWERLSMAPTPPELRFESSPAELVHATAEEGRQG